MKRDIGVADEMTLFVFGSRARSARNLAQSAPECTYLQFVVARSEGILKEDMCVSDEMVLLVLGLSAQRA